MNRKSHALALFSPGILSDGPRKFIRTDLENGLKRAFWHFAFSFKGGSPQGFERDASPFAYSEPRSVFASRLFARARVRPG